MDDDEAALLAELRAISAKSSASGRFAGGDDDDGNGNDADRGSSSAAPSGDTGGIADGAGAADPNEPPPPAPKPAAGTPPWKKKKKPAARKKKVANKGGGDLPPWKRKDAASSSAAAGGGGGGFDVEIAAPDLPPPPPGAADAGATDDAAAAADADAAPTDDVSVEGDNDRPAMPPSPPLPAQRKGGAGVEDGGFQSGPSTFQGERGGAAEDADLLAELRAISNTSAGDRFAGGDDGGDGGGGGAVASAAPDAGVADTDRSEAPAPAEAENAELPPWKRGKAKSKMAANKESGDVPPWKRKGKKQGGDATKDSFEVAVAEPPPPSASTEPNADDAGADSTAAAAGDPTSKSEEGGFEQASTFQGERGGAAEDAALLAELRAISNQSAGDRFAGGDDGDVGVAGGGAADGGAGDSAPSEASVPADKDDSELPPWKRGKAKKKNAGGKGSGDVPPWKCKGKKEDDTIDSFEVAVAGPPPPSEDPKADDAGAVAVEEMPAAKPDEGGFKQTSTFQGERGGSAEDADLLAELRAISQQSAGNRFQGEDNADAAPSNPPTGEVAESAQPEAPALAESEDADLPPWKRGKAKKKKKKANGSNAGAAGAIAVDEVPAAKPDEGGFKQTCTFQGERGGSAEDADLLAELRAISHKSTGDKFQGEDDGSAAASGAPVGITAEGAQPEAPALAESEDSDLPPWKRGKAKKKTKAANKDSGDVPPWKRKGKQEDTTDSFEVAVAGLPPAASTEQRGGEADIDATAAAAAPAAGLEEGGFPQTSTFQGERGGAAEDADLLAELRAISNKSTGDKFQGGDDDAAAGDAAAANETSDAAVPSETSAKTDDAELPPWKRGKAKKKAKSKGSSDVPPWKRKGKNQEDTTDSFEVAVAGPPPPTSAAEPEADGAGAAPTSEAVAEQESGGFKQTSTFEGERGGAAEDADLLAELRAISQQSAGDRFQGGEDDAVVGAEAADGTSGAAAPFEAPAKEDDSELPPWKRGKAKKKKAASKGSGDVPPWKRKGTKQEGGTVDSFEVANPPTATAEPEAAQAPADEDATDQAPAEQDDGGFKQESTFTGERGGAAEDADLLAELRAISSQSGGGNRFAGGNDDDNAGASAGAAADDKGVVEAPSAKADDADLPPWKRGKPKTKKPAAGKSKKSGDVPPWKRKAKNQEEDGAGAFEVAVAGPPSPSAESEQNNADATPTTAEPGQVPSGSEGDGFKQVSTFTGDRGGAAEDADLLAELRAISSKSGGGGRFPEDENGPGESGTEDATSASAETTEENGVEKLPPWKRGKAKKKKSSSKNGSDALPPWKQKGKKKEDAVDSVESSTGERSQPAETEGGFKPSGPSTFKGERGGAAEDADLLAELRAISTNTSGSRFQDKGDEGRSVVVDDSPAQHNVNTSNFKSETPSTFKGERGGAAEDADLLAELRAISGKGRGGDDAKEEPTGGASHTPESAPVVEATHQAPAPASVPTMQSEAPPPAEPLVTEETLAEALGSKDWKTRKAAYELLTALLKKKAGQQPANGSIDANKVLDSLDSSVPAMVKDSNAAALDAALVFSVLYADHCKEASSPEHAAKIVTLLFKGSGLSSSRPSTVKNSKALVLKLMEVGSEGAESVHSIVEVLLVQGLTSRKPKVVLNSVSLILDGARSFGAGALPLGAVSANAPKMLSHSNAKVRETGMQTIAEICRAAGSKAPLQVVIDSLKKAQVSQLDSLLEKQPTPSPPLVGLRSKKNNPGSEESPSDVLAALQAGSKEEDMKRFAARPAVNILEQLPKTEYAAKLKLAKWSEKVAAVDIVIKCGGEQPYKLAQPSPMVNYQPLVSEMKKLLEHTHFAVNSKAMAVLSMLAEGVGSALFPNLRPLLAVLTGLSKDKKLTKAIAKCLDCFFGNILSLEHLLDNDALPAAVDEKKQKNVLARKTSLEFLMRCIERGEEAGPKGAYNAKTAERAAKLACQKLKDTDATVRLAATNILHKLLASEDDSISDVTGKVVEGIKSDNPRAYKTLMTKKPGSKSAQEGGSSIPKQPKQRKETKDSISSGGEPEPKAARRPRAVPAKAEPTRSRPADRSGTKASVDTAPPVEEPEDGEIPSYDDAITTLTSLSVPNWDAAEDDDGVYAGLKSTNWKLRKAAIEALAEHAKSDEFKSQSNIPSAAMLVVVKEHTKSFKESNFNVVKAIMDLFLALGLVHEGQRQSPDYWICKAGVSLCVEKIADKKFATVAQPLLAQFCVIRSPATISGISVKCVEKIKAPLPHEALLKWHQEMTVDFGAAVLGNGVKLLISWVLKELGSSNIKIRKAALGLIGELHSQLGPVFKALLLANETTAAVKSQIESTIDSSPYDPSAAQASRNKTCMAKKASGGGSGGGQESGDGGSAALVLEIPKTDLVASLPPDCLSRMGTKEGKNAWKMRKEAMEEVSTGLEKCSGLVSTEPQCFKPLTELARALRDRLNDSQSNLKPLAARIIGSLLSSVDKASQAKLGRVVFPALLNAAMSDNKKMMREAALSSLREGTKLTAMEGGKPNTMSLESYISSLVSALKDSDFKATGLSEVLLLLTNNAEFLPKVENMTSSKAQALEKQFAVTLVACLTSKKSETRAAAEALLKACTDNDAIQFASIEQGTKKLLPAQQRTISSVIGKFQTGPASQPDKENVSNRSKAGRASSARSASAKAASETITSPQKSSRTLVRPSPDRKSSSRKFTSSAKLPESSLSVGPEETDSQHPLVSSNPNASTKEIRSSSLFRKKENWPEYPEEPGSCFSALKKSWAPLLPASSSAALFPKKGFQKQEDAVAGCDLLSKALNMDKADGGSTVVDQVDLINKWLACGICSREHTVGLQALLSLLLDLISFMTAQSYQLSDTEATVLLPHLFEKASAAKGRFREMFQDTISSISEGNLYPPQKYGPLVCVVVIERSSHAKARALATRECNTCVNVGGLSGIGKRGIQITSKAMSEESLAENKAAFLDLAVTVVSKMNGDINKYAKVCGSSNLSDKARQLVEERWARQSTKADTNPLENSRLSVGQGRRSAARGANSSGRRSTPSYASSPALGSKDGARASSLRRVSAIRAPNLTNKEESSSLSLRLGNAGSRGSPRVDAQALGSATAKDSPFTFSYSKAGASNASNQSPLRTGSSLSLLQAWERQKQESSVEASAPPPVSRVSEVVTPSSSRAVEPRRVAESHDATNSAKGGAASLRARLEQIRSKNRTPMPSRTEEGAAPGGTDARLPLPPRTQHASPEYTSEPESLLPPVHPPPTIEQVENPYEAVMSTLGTLLRSQTPLPVDDPIISRASSGLEKAHASLAKDQRKIVQDLDATELQDLRRGIMSNLNAFVDRLMRVLDFSFDCAPKNDHGGISVLFATLAVSVAQQIFVNDDMSHLLSSSETLALVIQKTVTGLLDARIANPSDAAPNEWHDADVKKLSKCINKLAIQAAVSSPRQTSFPALMSLQLQCCTAIAQDATGQGADSLNCRLARVVTKLCSKVAKTEEAEKSPYSENVGINVILIHMQDTLTASQATQLKFGNSEAMKPCNDAVETVLRSAAKAKKAEGGAEYFRPILEDIGIDSHNSLLGKLLSKLDVGRAPSTSRGRALSARHNESSSIASGASVNLAQSTSKNTDNYDVTLASLVSDIAKTDDRQRSLASLRAFMADNPTVDIHPHLETLSANFRAYILDQLQLSEAAGRSRAVSASSSMRSIGNSEDATRNNLPISERLRSLRSKVNATETAVQSVKNGSAPNSSPQSPQAERTSPQPKSRDEGTATHPEQATKTKSVSSIRERLAAANSSRPAPAESSSALGHAAALRARLEAVRKGKQKD